MPGWTTSRSNMAKEAVESCFAPGLAHAGKPVQVFFIESGRAGIAFSKGRTAALRCQSFRFSKVNVFNLLPRQIENLELTHRAKMVLVGVRSRGSGRPNIAKEHSIIKEGCIHAMARPKGIQGN